MVQEQLCCAYKIFPSSCEMQVHCIYEEEEEDHGTKDGKELVFPFSALIPQHVISPLDDHDLVATLSRADSHYKNAYKNDNYGGLSMINHCGVCSV